MDRPGSIGRALGFQASTIDGTAGGTNVRQIQQPLCYTLTEVGP
jgi:hypothetical protein